jgi:hypothetical protein
VKLLTHDPNAMPHSIHVLSKSDSRIDLWVGWDSNPINQPTNNLIPHKRQQYFGEISEKSSFLLAGSSSVLNVTVVYD